MQLTVKNPVMDTEVLVLGGGPAGCGAAIAAAHRGAKVTVIEQATALGGMATGGMVSRLTRLTDEEKVIYRSLTVEIMERYKKISGAQEDWKGRLPLYTEALKMTLDEMFTEAGISVLYQTVLCDASVKEREDGMREIEYAFAANKAGITPLRAGIYIDCTGDGDLAAAAGAPFEKGDENGEMQPTSLCFAISNIHREARPDLPYTYINNGKNSFWKNKEAEIHAKYPLTRNTHFVPVWQGDGTLYANAGHVEDIDSTDPASFSGAYALGRAIAEDYLKALKEEFPDIFGDAVVVATAPLLGVRESRRIMGEYVLTADDYVKQRSFPDEICRNHNWLDCHASHNRDNPYSARLQPGESHGIPWRCLIPRGFDNLLVAGRAISMDREVLSSVRVMPNCIQTGEAAGIGAALAVSAGTGVHAIDSGRIRKELGME